MFDGGTTPSILITTAHSYVYLTLHFFKADSEIHTKTSDEGAKMKNISRLITVNE